MCGSSSTTSTRRIAHLACQATAGPGTCPDPAGSRGISRRRRARHQLLHPLAVLLDELLPLRRRALLALLTLRAPLPRLRRVVERAVLRVAVPAARHPAVAHAGPVARVGRRARARERRRRR